MRRLTFLLACFVFISGCDIGKGLINNYKSYSEPEMGNTARVRFVSTADDVRLYTNTTCASVNNDVGSVFYRRYPYSTRPSRSIGMPMVGQVPEPYVEYDVPAGEPIVVRFYKRYPVANGELVCNLLVTFTPETAKDYQLQLLSENPTHSFFQKNKNICYLAANEIIKTKDGYKLSSLDVKPTDFCRRHQLVLFK